jgi:hypothetical protein
MPNARQTPTLDGRACIPKADIAAASRRCNKPPRTEVAAEIADDRAASGPYRIASQEQEVSREKLK